MTKFPNCERVADYLGDMMTHIRLHHDVIATMLPKDVLIEVLSAQPTGRHLIGAWTCLCSRCSPFLRLLWNDISVTTIPRTFFKPNAVNSPNFLDLEVIDHGQTFRLGAYQAAVDTVVDLPRERPLADRH